MNDKPFSDSNAVDMSSSAISSRLREVSDLHQLGLSLAKAKPMAIPKLKPNYNISSSILRLAFVDSTEP